MEVVLIIMAVGITSAVIGCIAFAVEDDEKRYKKWLKEQKRKEKNKCTTDK